MGISRMILRNHTYLKVYKCWRILLILKNPTIKCLAIFFIKYFNFQGFYMVYIIIWRFLGWKRVYPVKIGWNRASKIAKWWIFFRENPLKIAHGINFAPKIIPKFVTHHQDLCVVSIWRYVVESMEIYQSFTILNQTKNTMYQV